MTDPADVRALLSAALTNVRAAIATAAPKDGRAILADRLAADVAADIVRLAAVLRALAPDAMRALAQDQPSDPPLNCRADEVDARIAAQRAATKAA